jgi:glutaminyl-tRNA synthetase
MSDSSEPEDSAPRTSRNFIEVEIDRDLAEGRTQQVHTRFPPEPNGYLHLGHAKAICVSFGFADQYQGLCNLRFDDTNPSKEEDRYVKAIQDDVRWLGFDWQERLYFASDFFEELYGFAQHLIESGHAYVDDLGVDEMRRHQQPEPGSPGPSEFGSVWAHARRGVRRGELCPAGQDRYGPRESLDA